MALRNRKTRCDHIDKGYRRFTAALRREMKRRAAIEPAIGHLKVERRMDPNYLMGHEGDLVSAVLAATGYDFGLLPRWFTALLRALIRAINLRAWNAQFA